MTLVRKVSVDLWNKIEDIKSKYIFDGCIHPEDSEYFEEDMNELLRPLDLTIKIIIINNIARAIVFDKDDAIITLEVPDAVRTVGSTIMTYDNFREMIEKGELQKYSPGSVFIIVYPPDNIRKCYVVTQDHEIKELTKSYKEEVKDDIKLVVSEVMKSNDPSDYPEAISNLLYELGYRKVAN